MTDASSTQVALNNLREFQEMSYSDVYALIRQKRFDEAKEKYTAVLENMGVDEFDAARELKITTSHDDLLECMSGMAEGVDEPEKIRGVGFDLSAHALFHDENGNLNQGIEVSLFSEDVYDFTRASDEQLTQQCENTASDWQGHYMDIGSVALDGLGEIAQQFKDHAQAHENSQGILETEEGAVIVDPVAIARHVAKLLVAIEYHRYMAEFVSEVEVPMEMVFIIGEHDEIEVPIVFYRVGEAQAEAQDDVQPAAQADMSAEEPGEAPHELPDEETPPLYDNAAENSDEETAEPVDTAASGAGARLYEQAKAQAEAQAEPVAQEEPVVAAAEVQQQPTDEIYEIPEASAEEVPIEPAEAPKGEPMVSAQSTLGKPLAAKAFGQRSNKIFNDESEEEESA